MLSKLKLLLGISDTSKDTLLTEIISEATQDAKNYTHWDDVDFLESTIIQMAKYRYSMLNSSELESESYSGVSFSYRTQYPTEIYDVLKANRKMRMY